MHDYPELFKALSDSTRLKILQVLKDHKECSVNELCTFFKGVTQPTISHHLQVLKRNQLVNAQKRGKMVLYTMNFDTLEKSMQTFIFSFKSTEE